MGPSEKFLMENVSLVKLPITQCDKGQQNTLFKWDYKPKRLGTTGLVFKNACYKLKCKILVAVRKVQHFYLNCSRGEGKNGI